MQHSKVSFQFLPRQSGFTLIEVLVVLVILAVLAGFALLALPAATQAPEPEDQLRQTLRQLCIEALDQATPMALVLARGEMTFQRWSGGWQHHESRLLRDGRVPRAWGAVRIMRSDSGREDQETERLVCSADGELLPARVELSGSEPLRIMAGNQIVPQP